MQKSVCSSVLKILKILLIGHVNLGQRGGREIYIATDFYLPWLRKSQGWCLRRPQKEDYDSCRQNVEMFVVSTVLTTKAFIAKTAIFWVVTQDYENGIIRMADKRKMVGFEWKLKRNCQEDLVRHEEQINTS